MKRERESTYETTYMLLAAEDTCTWTSHRGKWARDRRTGWRRHKKVAADALQKTLLSKLYSSTCIQHKNILYAPLFYVHALQYWIFNIIFQVISNKEHRHHKCSFWSRWNSFLKDYTYWLDEERMQFEIAISEKKELIKSHADIISAHHLLYLK